MKRKKLKKKIESLSDRIKEHKDKIAAERQISFPDEGCIAHWEKEIAVFKKEIDKTLRKLEG